VFRLRLSYIAAWALALCSMPMGSQTSGTGANNQEIVKLKDLVRLGSRTISADQTSAFVPFDEGQNFAPAVTKEHPLFIGINALPTGVQATYTYALDTDYHPIPAGGIPFPDDRAMVLVRLQPTVTVKCPEVQPAPQPNAAANALDYADLCDRYVIYSRDLVPARGPSLAPAFVISADGLEISGELAKFTRDDLKNANYVVNHSSISQMRVNTLGPIVVGTATKDFLIERYAGSSSCTMYQPTDYEYFDYACPGPSPPNLAIDNGIVVAPSKTFDNSTLKQMLAGTSAQLASISGFNQSVIMGAVGNIQGITSDSSYVSAQVTTLAPSSVSSTATNGGTTSNTLANTLGVNNGSTISNSTITCPPGTLPGVGTSGLPACAAVVAGTATVGSTGAGNNNGGSSSSSSQQSNIGSTLSSALNLGQTSNQQNTVTTTNNPQAGVVAAVPTSTALTAPTNVGVSASDMLAEQVQLNSEITTLRLLLQGALSDQYLTAEGRAIGTRQQTTVGFGIYLDPPQRYKHAVAEVRIWIDPADTDAPVSVMNLLPAAKTYNVAKITSRQNAFGAGVAVEALNVGAATGKSKNRLFLAKDTDTVALQYQAHGSGSNENARPLSRSSQEKVRDVLRQGQIWQKIVDACEDDPIVDSGTTVIDWQFRPVLGADYVQAGQRLVYAQLALPTGIGAQFEPRVIVQTRWREYDENRQVVGAVYKGSCSVAEDTGTMTVISPLLVKDVSVHDMGGGTLKVVAQGDFFSSDYSVMSASNTILPTAFDGKSIQVFGNAGALLIADDLKLVDKDGKPRPLARSERFHDNCGVVDATMSATPRPDGNSIVEATITTGDAYSSFDDPAPNPLVLIGTHVYGLHETPFIDQDCQAAPAGAGVACTYHFLAATDVLRTAETFRLKDLAWEDFQADGKIDFQPSFSSLSVLGTPKASTPSTSPATPPAAGCTPEKAKAGKCPPVKKAAPKKPDPPALYSLTGFELTGLKDTTNWNCDTAGCLEVYRGLNPFCLAKSNFQVVSKTNAVLALNGSDYQIACAKSNAEDEAVSEGMDEAASKKYVKKAVDEATAQEKSASSLYDYKSLRLIYHPEDDTAVEWDLSVPKQTPASVTASAILNVGDSTQISFSGVVLAGQVQSLMYESTVFPTTSYKYDSTKQSLSVQIPSALTSKAGHKELILTDSVLDSTGKPNQILLPFDVTRR